MCDPSSAKREGSYQARHHISGRAAVETRRGKEYVITSAGGRQWRHDGAKNTSSHQREGGSGDTTGQRIILAGSAFHQRRN